MKWILPVWFAMIVSGCGRKSEVPPGVLPPERMERVLWDMIQADEYLRNYVYHKDTADDDTLTSVRVYRQIFELHNTSRAEFDSSYNYYRRHTALLKEILDTLSTKGKAYQDGSDGPTQKLPSGGSSIPWPDPDSSRQRIRKQIPLE